MTMNAVDTGTLQYYNRPLRVPSAAAGVRGSGARVGSTSKIDTESPLWKSCQDFEAIFIKMMLKQMKATVDKAGLVSGGYAEEIFDDMLTDEYAGSMSKNAKFGLSESLYRQLSS
ncbi:MAG: rod-binding protein [Spirochaetes bacterium]|nr:rod-binding protein [Spirochaetota bacterium]